MGLRMLHINKGTHIARSAGNWCIRDTKQDRQDAAVFNHLDSSHKVLLRDLLSFTVSFLLMFVKCCQSIQTNEAQLTENGIEGDR